MMFPKEELWSFCPFSLSDASPLADMFLQYLGNNVTKMRPNQALRYNTWCTTFHWEKCQTIK